MVAAGAEREQVTQSPDRRRRPYASSRSTTRRTSSRRSTTDRLTASAAHVSGLFEHVFVRSTILHADLDAFYASVEQRDDPRLRNRPVAVGGGVILACSYEAKRRGVTTPMGGRQARALCPDLIIVRPRFDAYLEASKAVFELFHRTTPQVQGVSIDEAFLDVAGLHRIDVAPVDIAARLRAQVRDVVGLPITVGVARTPFLAKVASRVAKPDGLLLVLPADEDAFLHPLPVELLWGVGAVTAAKLHAYGLATAGDVAALPRSVLVGVLGPAAGGHLHAVVHGQTTRAVVVGQVARVDRRAARPRPRPARPGVRPGRPARPGRPGVPSAAQGRPARRGPWCCGCGSRTTPRPPGRGRSRPRRTRRRTSPRGRDRAPGRGRAADPRTRAHPGGRRAVRAGVGRSSSSWPCPWTTPTGRASTTPWTRSRSGSARRP